MMSVTQTHAFDRDVCVLDTEVVLCSILLVRMDAVLDDLTVLVASEDTVPREKPWKETLHRITTLLGWKITLTEGNLQLFREHWGVHSHKNGKLKQ